MDLFPAVTKFMATKLVTFTPDTDIHVAIDTMLKRKISGAPVLDQTGKLVGMLSEVDCLGILLEGPYNEEPGRIGTVADYMSRSVRTISSEKTVLDAAYEFVHSGLKRLPVCENGRLVGQISRIDVLKAVQKLRPVIRHVPDSWKGRAPVVPVFKSKNYTENA
jgi:CBS domain-containing protein